MQSPIATKHARQAQIQQTKPEGTAATTYGEILRASAIIGGANGVNYIIGMVRTKLVALLLGPSGVGLVGLYQSAIGLVATLSGLGLGQSGVRDVAAAHGAGDPHRIAHTVKTLRRMSWLTGLAGWILTAALSYPLSLWAFGSGGHTWAVAALGVALIFGAVSNAQSAIIQGTRRIGDLARLNVLGAMAGTVVAVGLYAWLGQRAIVPVLILTAACNLGGSWWFARRIQTVRVAQNWRETFINSRQLVSLGAAFMYGEFLTNLVALVVRGCLVKKLGVEANGVYMAAWTISGLFAGFIVTAIGTDFFPRLTAVANDNKQVNRLVNEQTEIGILLAIPGLVATLVFAPLFMRLFYSAQFLAGADLLPWFVLNSFVRIFMFPIGFISRAKGATRWIFVCQTWINGLNIVVVPTLISWYGLAGTGYAAVMCILLFYGLVFFVGRHLSGFAYVRATGRVFGAAFFLIGIALAVRTIPVPSWSMGMGTVATLAATTVSLRGIACRLGRHNRAVEIACRCPGGAWLCGVVKSR